ncbi:hypothetical protein PR202_gb12322 [Eleusine coracana subsp. coracana]|uniref:Uncharacterized protein n=1 Tax=Eleusine coracana subsp. coracana TaxID=191504 RepID=A0AAV5EP98_ELECO|nr:hypothetical protein PR202_gb12322 [Eleusine coracana subsp. coracana]
MACLYHSNDHPCQLRSSFLRVVPPLYDSIEQFPSRTQLHDKVHRDSVLISTNDGDNIGVAGEVMHNLYLAAHVLDVFLADELPLGDGLAGEYLTGGLLYALVGGAKLPLSQLLAQGVEVLEPLGVTFQDGADKEAGALHALHLRPGLAVRVRRGGGGVGGVLGIGEGDGLGRPGGSRRGGGGPGVRWRRGLGPGGGGWAPEHGEGDGVEETMAVRGGRWTGAGVPHRAGEEAAAAGTLGGLRQHWTARTVGDWGSGD